MQNNYQQETRFPGTGTHLSVCSHTTRSFAHPIEFYLFIYLFIYLFTEVRYREKISIRISTAEYITTSPYNKQKDAFRANKSKLASQETSQR